MKRILNILENTPFEVKTSAKLLNNLLILSTLHRQNMHFPLPAQNNSRKFTQLVQQTRSSWGALCTSSTVPRFSIFTSYKKEAKQNNTPPTKALQKLFASTFPLSLQPFLENVWKMVIIQFLPPIFVDPTS